MRAGFSQHTWTSRSRVMRPSWTPWVSITGRKVSTREKPVRQSQSSGGTWPSGRPGARQPRGRRRPRRRRPGPRPATGLLGIAVAQGHVDAPAVEGGEAEPGRPVWRTAPPRGGGPRNLLEGLGGGGVLEYMRTRAARPHRRRPGRAGPPACGASGRSRRPVVVPSRAAALEHPAISQFSGGWSRWQERRSEPPAPSPGTGAVVDPNPEPGPPARPVGSAAAMRRACM